MGASRSTAISDAQLDNVTGGTCPPCAEAVAAVDALSVAKIAFVMSLLP